MRSEAYLSEIRTSAGLKRAVLRKIVLEGKTVTFFLATDTTYTEQDIAHAEKVSYAYVPEGYTARVHIAKSIPDGEDVRRCIADLLKTQFPAAAAFVSPEDINVNVDGTGGRFFIGVSKEDRARFEAGKILDALSGELQRRYCGGWYGDFREVVKERGEIEIEAPEPEEYTFAARSFPVADFRAIDGAKVERALYIADLREEAHGIALCGRVSYVEERETKNGKPYFVFTFADGSGQMRTAYFSKKATVEKVRAITAGDWVCFTGDNEVFQGGFSFRAKSVDYGEPPKGYVFETRPSRPVPAAYRAVFPRPFCDMEQAALFQKDALPEDFLKEKFVVFDLETTGLNTSGANGSMDRMIEIGAVKIAEGKVCEKFSSFIACPTKLSKEIVSLTGITDEMLLGAPETDDVVADFYKFTDGCSLVGHNIQFDYKFIRHYGEAAGYLFEQRQYDTLTIAQEELRLSNYKLNTVADYFGFRFNHHRAFDDAFVTAKIFIELVRLKKSLPKSALF